MSKPPASSLMDRACAAHLDAVGSKPNLRGQAPGTWPVVGEHTDEYGGVVALLPLGLHTAVVASPRGDRTITVRGDVAGTEVRAHEAALGEAPESAQVTLAQRAAHLVSAFVQRQVLSRETSGFDLTVCSDVPLGSGLGALHSFDAALGLALYPETGETDEAPLRARLASVCSGAVSALPGSATLRARHIAALRCTAGSLCVVDYADGSVTTAPLSLAAAHQGADSSDPRIAAYALGYPDAHRGPTAPPHAEEKRQRARLIAQATHDFRTDSLRVLPDATPRVLEWLQAARSFHGPGGYPTIATAASWLQFWEEETARGQRVVSLLRGRNHGEIPRLLGESQRALAEIYGDETGELVELCREHGASSARATWAGSSAWVAALVAPDEADGFRAAMQERGLTVVPLIPGQPGHAAEA
ncbi:galactokinase [Corynebacterium mastitidis]|uniref:Galactokinase n=1 Tax=Corynebacterium mastitidis TaxID=161890 RepID=A0ABU8NX45_9CORY